MIEFVYYSDIVEDNGLTVRENNNLLQHTIPIGTLVEVKYDTWHGNGVCEKVHARLLVIKHSRDCDGTPIYVLGKSLTLKEYYLLAIPGYKPTYIEKKDLCFSIESLTVIEVTPEIIDGCNALEWSNGE